MKKGGMGENGWMGVAAGVVSSSCRGLGALVAAVNL